MLRASLAAGVDRVVALGPLTNVALVAREEPALFAETEIVWMGGTLGRGNVTAVAEFNAFADPAAASLVLGSGIAVRVIGLDVTESVALVPAEIEAMALRGSPLGDTLQAVLEALVEAERPNLGELALLHDPCAVFAAFGEDLFRYADTVVEVTVEDSENRGRLLARDPGDGMSSRVATEAHVSELKREFSTRLRAWAGAA